LQTLGFPNLRLQPIDKINLTSISDFSFVLNPQKFIDILLKVVRVIMMAVSSVDFQGNQDWAQKQKSL
jgi:hypothetical protein